jgi:hypothetical protein
LRSRSVPVTDAAGAAGGVRGSWSHPVNTRLRELQAWVGECLDCGVPTQLRLLDGGQLEIAHRSVPSPRATTVAATGKIRHLGRELDSGVIRVRCNARGKLTLHPLIRVWQIPVCRVCRRIEQEENGGSG